MGGLKFRVFDQLPDETWFNPGYRRDCTLDTERTHTPQGTTGHAVTSSQPPATLNI